MEPTRAGLTGEEDATGRGEEQPLLLANLTWEETRDRLPEIDLVLIPVGAHEQHGPGIAVSTDTVSAEALCHAAAARVGPRVAVAPAVPWGVSWAHMGFPGTITVRPETLVALLTDVIASLHAHGFQRFLVVNGHGGNAAAVTTAVEVAKQATNPRVVAAVYGYALLAEQAVDLLPQGAAGHGGGDEAAVVMAVLPDLTRPERASTAQLTGTLAETAALLRAYGGTLAGPYAEVTRNGATGNSAAAWAEAGRKILAGAAERLAVIVETMVRESAGDA